MVDCDLSNNEIFHSEISLHRWCEYLCCEGNIFIERRNDLHFFSIIVFRTTFFINNSNISYEQFYFNNGKIIEKNGKKNTFLFVDFVYVSDFVWAKFSC